MELVSFFMLMLNLAYDTRRNRSNGNHLSNTHLENLYTCIYGSL
jgi:hypothetical protein